jgi:hypothetical protein
MAGIIRDHFETEANTYKYLSQWRDTTLLSVIAQYPKLSKLQCLDKLFEKLETIRSTIATSQTNYDLKNQVLAACKGVPEYIFVLYSPGPTYEAVCAQLRSSITAT